MEAFKSEKVPEEDLKKVKKIERKVRRELGVKEVRLLLAISDEFKETAIQTLFNEEEEPLIMFNYESDIVQRVLKDGTALEGILLHENMHILQEESEKYVELIEKIKKSANKHKNEFREKKKLQELLQTVVMVLKDLMVNDELLKKGEGKKLLKYYENSIRIKPKTRTEIDVDYWNDLFVAVISLVPAWIPFYRNNMRKEGANIRNLIHDKYSEVPIKVSQIGNQLMDELMEMHMPPEQEEADELFDELISLHDELSDTSK